MGEQTEDPAVPGGDRVDLSGLGPEAIAGLAKSAFVMVLHELWTAGEHTDDIQVGSHLEKAMHLPELHEAFAGNEGNEGKPVTGRDRVR